jgi:hypothetical protein
MLWSWTLAKGGSKTPTHDTHVGFGGAANPRASHHT